MFPFIVYFGLMGATLLVALRSPAAALGALMCTYGLEQWAMSQHEFFYAHGTLTNLLTGSLVLAALAIRQVKGTNVLAGGLPVEFWITISLLGFAAIAIAWSPFEGAAARYWNYVPYIGAFTLLMPLLIKDPREMRSALFVMMLMGGTILSLIVFDSRWDSRFILLKQGAQIGSVIGNRGNPLATASLAGYVSLAALLLNFRGASRIWQFIRWPLIGIALVVAFKSGSRGQLFAMVAAGILFLPLSRRLKNVAGFVGMATGVGLLLILATWAFDTFAATDADRWDTQNMVDTWSDSRLETSRIVLAAWMEGGPVTWLVGLGFAASFDASLLRMYPHLVMAETLAELGFIGFVLLWALVIAAFTRYARLHRFVSDDVLMRGTCAATAAIFMFEIILSFKQGSLISNVVAFGVAIAMGRMYVWTRTPEARAEIASQSAGAQPGHGLLLAPPHGPLADGRLLGGPAPMAGANGSPAQREQRGPRRRVQPIFLPDQRPSQAGF